jgi:ComF family protein
LPIKRYTSKIVDFFFPRSCVGCGKGGDFICARCRNSLPYLPDSVCIRCGKPISGYDVCPSCRSSQASINGIRSLFRFDGVIRKAIHAFKYSHVKALADPFAELLYSYLLAHPLEGNVLVPVPLHPDRLRARGYNQSALLARRLGIYSNLPVIENCLIRVKNSIPQVQTTKSEERVQNVAGAFICRDRRLQGKYVILIDDVCTTGSTLDACAVALKKSGISSIWGITLAREI